MPEFDYTAVAPGHGRVAQGTIIAPHQGMAVLELKTRGLAPTSLVLRPPSAANSAAPGGGAGSATNPDAGPDLRRKWKGFTISRVVGRKGLMLFTRHLATLLKAGLPLHRALQVLARAERNRSFQEVILCLAEAISSGSNLADGFRQSPRVFDELYRSMITAGEAGGVLDLVLDRLARFLERNDRIKGRIKAAMTYPVIILTVACGILSGLVVFVVPKFQLIFSGVLKGQPLPPLTQLVLDVSNFSHHHLVAAIGLLLLAGLAGRQVRRTPLGTRIADWVQIKSPIFGDFLLKAAIARFARTFGALLASGVPILEALEITRATSGNVHVSTALKVVHERVKGGGMVAPALEESGIFPHLVSSMIGVGEETGALADMLGRVADIYDEEVDNAVAALTAMIEPIMILLMALLVGVIVIALFLPMAGILQHLQ